MRRVSLICISACLCLPSVTLADTAVSKSTPAASHPTKQPTKKKPINKIDKATPGILTTAQNMLNQVNFAGYIEGSYNYLMRSSKFTSGVYDRVFDIEPNGWTVQQLAMMLSKNPSDGFGAMLNLLAGRDASQIAPYGLNPSSMGFTVPQAYLEYKTPTFDIFVGELLSISGVEQINPSQDANFSRSILFGYAKPNTVLGMRVIYTTNSRLNFIAGINNGWDNIRDTSRRKTVELGTSYSITPKWSVFADVSSGEERSTPDTAFGPMGTRNLFDISTTYLATDKITLVGNYDYARQSQATLPGATLGRATWQGVAGYFNYKFNDIWRTSIRGEIFNDQNGYRTGVRQGWKEMTLTAGYAPIKNLELRAEFRHDYSNVASFVKSYNGLVSNNQQSYAIEGTYLF